MFSELLDTSLTIQRNKNPTCFLPTPTTEKRHKYVNKWNSYFSASSVLTCFPPNRPAFENCYRVCNLPPTLLGEINKGHKLKLPLSSGLEIMKYQSEIMTGSGIPGADGTFFACNLSINSSFVEFVSLSPMHGNFLSFTKKSPLLSIKLFLEEKDF